MGIQQGLRKLRRMLQMPFRRVLVSLRERQCCRFVEETSQENDACWVSCCIESARNGNRGIGAKVSYIEMDPGGILLILQNILGHHMVENPGPRLVGIRLQ